jgi:leucyl-tRNA synthetase
LRRFGKTPSAMEYDFLSIETAQRKRWNEDETYRVTEGALAPDGTPKKKFYALDMFPYPSGAGLHVGHPLGYIASDVIARYKRHQGYNVLHPMGYDSFGLPAEQYAIQTGQHPAVTTETNIARYRQQMDLLGFSFDWSREVRTSDPAYYKWTQWIFGLLYQSWYDVEAGGARPIAELVARFEREDKAWATMDEGQKSAVLMEHRLAYLADSQVNWCPALGTVLANDEISGGRSERGGHAVEQKTMRQWIMRITAYADRLIDDLDTVDWPSSIVEIQRNWIGKSTGASICFEVAGTREADKALKIEVFSTRPDTIYGASFIVLAPEHDLVKQITTEEMRKKVEAYCEQAGAASERERMSGERGISGVFTGAYAVSPISGEQLPIWAADYVLAGYGTGAVMAVPAGDERDWAFARHFDLPIPAIFEGHDTGEGATVDKSAVLMNSGALDGLAAKDAMAIAIELLEEKGAAEARVNYRLRDAVFSRQRYWGEPFPIRYKDGIPQLVEDGQVVLPEVDEYLPTADGDPPLARATRWSVPTGERMEYNTMPGWAGSSWYFLRYMDPANNAAFCDRSKSDYWGQVDLYIGGAEHGTGHLLYSRFWTKFLFDRGLIGFHEPFKKMVNQGMILGRSSFVYRIEGGPCFVSFDRRKEFKTQRLHVDVSLVDGDVLDTEAFKNWRPEYANATFELSEDGSYRCGSEVEKMSKSKFNVENPDDLVERYGADTLRCYEMFLGPLEQAKPWDTKGISGVHNFLRKLARLYRDQDGACLVVDSAPAADGLRTVHKTIKKVSKDLDRLSWNTVVSAMMIGVNELTAQDAHQRELLEPLAVLLSPYAPHLAEDLWSLLGKKGSVCDAPWPVFDAAHLVEAEVTYPVSFNGKVRFELMVAADMSPADVEAAALGDARAAAQLEGNSPKKVIVVPGRIVNIVV